jgi:hypothetical protein
VGDKRAHTRLQARNILILPLRLVPLSYDRGDGLAGLASHDAFYCVRVLCPDKTSFFSQRQLSK